MFWRRKKEGFVWQEYVRTTILVRRDQRRQRIEDIRDAAVDGLKQGARNGVALSAAGVRAAALALVHGLAAAYYAATDMMAAMAAATALWLADRSKQAAPALSAAIVRLVEATRVPALSVSLLFVGAVAAMAASAHWGAHGFDAKTLQFAGLACVALILAALPRLAALGNRIGGFIAALPGLSGSDRGNQTGTRPLTSALPAAVLTYGIPLALLAGLTLWIAPVLTASSTAPQSVLTANPVVTAASGRIEGRAVALTGGQLKVAGERVRLDGRHTGACWRGEAESTWSVRRS